MASNQPEGNIRGGDQPRMTEKQLGRDQRAMGQIGYSRQAQRGPMPRGGYGRMTRKG